MDMKTITNEVIGKISEFKTMLISLIQGALKFAA